MGALGEKYPYCKQMSKILEGEPLNFRFSPANATSESENCYLLKGNHETALQYYHDAIKKDPNNFVYESELALTYNSLQRWDEAISHFRSALHIKETDDFSYNGLGHAYFGKGLLKQSVDQYLKAVSINPREPSYYASLSVAYGRLRMWPEAIRYAKLADQKANVINPSDNSYLHYSALAYHEKGLQLYNSKQYKDAIEELKIAKSYKEFDETYWILYLCAYALNDFKEAKIYLERAYELNPNPKYTTALRDKKLPREQQV